MTFQEIIEKIRHFRDERDWLQFHNHKDLAIALSIEANELLEHFLWKTEEEVAEKLDTEREAVLEEVADIGIYLFELVDILGISLPDLMEKKLAKNALRYPVAKARGSNRKYDQL